MDQVEDAIWTNIVGHPSDEPQRSPHDKIGLNEEGKLSMLTGEDGIEQLSVYCREFAQRSVIVLQMPATAICAPFNAEF